MNYAQKIAAKLLCEKESEKISELGTSAIEEVANILTGSFFNALSAATGFRIELSTPDYQQGNLSSLANGTAINILKTNGNTVIADAELVGNDSGIRIHMLIMQQANNARKLLEQIKKSQKSNFSSIKKSKLKLEDFDSNNSELDSLVEEILQNEGERNQ
jgi:chemotaxis protein CheC